MTVDAALAYALVIRDAENERDLALVTLAAEVRRLRAAAAGFLAGSAYGDDRWVKVSDVLRILEGDQ